MSQSPTPASLTQDTRSYQFSRLNLEHGEKKDPVLVYVLKARDEAASSWMLNSSVHLTAARLPFIVAQRLIYKKQTLYRSCLPLL